MHVFLKFTAAIVVLSLFREQFLQHNFTLQVHTLVHADQIHGFLLPLVIHAVIHMIPHVHLPALQ